MNEHCFLFGMARNQSRVAFVFFHCLTPVLVAITLFMRSRICLLTFPISNFDGLINLQVGSLDKFSL